MPPLIAAALFMALNATLVATDAVLVRLVSGEVHALEIAFFRNLFSLLALLVLLRPRQLTLRAGGLWPAHIIRAVVKLAALVCSFLAITRLPIALVTAIAFTMPLFVTLGSALILRERVGMHRVLALLAGLMGMLIIVQPQNMGVEFGSGVALALASAAGLAAVALLMKFTSGREEPLRIVWFNLIVTVPIALLVALPVWSWPSPTTLALLAVQGVGGLVAQLSMARAMKLADASLIITIDFIRLPIAALLGLAIFSEPIEGTVLAGGAIIFAGVIFGAVSERGRRARLDAELS